MGGGPEGAIEGAHAPTATRLGTPSGLGTLFEEIIVDHCWRKHVTPVTLP